MSIVERERERLEHDDDTPRMRHIAEYDAAGNYARNAEGRTLAMCGTTLPFYWEIGLDAPDFGPCATSDCIACAEAARAKGYL